MIRKETIYLTTRGERHTCERDALWSEVSDLFAQAQRVDPAGRAALAFEIQALLGRFLKAGENGVPPAFLVYSGEGAKP